MFTATVLYCIGKLIGHDLSLTAWAAEEKEARVWAEARGLQIFPVPFNGYYLEWTAPLCVLWAIRTTPAFGEELVPPFFSSFDAEEFQSVLDIELSAEGKLREEGWTLPDPGEQRPVWASVPHINKIR